SLIFRTPVTMMLISALALLPMALACGAGTGAITAKPQLKFRYSPPTSWTYNTGTTGSTQGQSGSETAAQNRINQDIEYAVMKAVESYGYIPSGVSVKNAIAPTNIALIAAGTNTCTSGWGFVVDGVVTKQCSVITGTATETSTTAPLFRKDGTMTVTSPIPLFESQWEAIAKKVKTTLTNNAGVTFFNDIEVA
ncbi:hypothetical protein PENTCL1PPCAC_10966, partial [Pristionchus entomophagus]